MPSSMPRDSEEYIIPSVAGCHMLHATIDPVSSLEQRVLASWDSTNAAQSEPLRGRSSPVFAASSPHVETATADTITLSGSQLVKCIIHYNNKPYPGKNSWNIHSHVVYKLPPDQLSCEWVSSFLTAHQHIIDHVYINNWIITSNQCCVFDSMVCKHI